MTLRGKMVEGRWFELVAQALPDGEVVFSRGEEGYSGQVDIVARLDDGRWLHYGWSYGSCSGCDAWEETPEAEVIEEIRRGAAVLDAAHFADYLVSARAQGAWWLDDEPGAVYPLHVGLTTAQLVAAVVAKELTPVGA